MQRTHFMSAVLVACLLALPALADCVPPAAPAPYASNPNLYRGFVLPGDDGDDLRLINVLATTPTGGLYSGILVSYDAHSDTIQVLTAYHNLTFRMHDDAPLPIRKVRSNLLGRPQDMDLVHLSQELLPIPGAIFCRSTAQADSITSVRMIDVQTPTENDGTHFLQHPIDIALVTYKLSHDVVLNSTELYRLSARFAINGTYTSSALGSLVDGHDRIVVTGWGSPRSGELQILSTRPDHPQARYWGQPKPGRFPYRTSFDLYQDGPVVELLGFSGGGVFLRNGDGHYLLLGIDSGQYKRHILFTTLYRGTYRNLLGWLREHLDTRGWSLPISRR